MKVCTGCFTKNSLDSFHKDKTKSDGRHSKCKNCRKSLAQNYYKNNRDIILESNITYGKDNREKRRLYAEKYRKDNLPLYAAHRANYRAQKKQRTFPGYEIEIRTIYQNCPKGYEVDHIVPLNGISVSGLHVPWNLQYLTKFENRKKGKSYR